MTFHTKIVGVTFEGRQRLISKLNRNNGLEPGTPLRLVPEINNIYDQYAVKVVTLKGEQLGYISRELNRDIHNNLLSGRREYNATVASVSGGQSDNQNYGINIKIEVKY